MAGFKRKYSWEMESVSERYDWEADSGMPEPDADSSDDLPEEEESVDPTQELLDYLVDQHQAGSLTAKQVCVICYWAGQAGLEKAKGLGLPPWTKGTGDFKRLLDKKIGQEGPRLYSLNMPMYSRKQDTRALQPLPVLLPHELLEQELANEDLAALRSAWQPPPHFGEHPVVRKAAPGGHAVVPLSVFLDGVAYAKKDSLLGLTIHNLLTGKRFVVCVLRKRLLCKCGCRGWDSLHAMFLWLRWCLEVLATGKRPLARHDGQGWDPVEDEDRLHMAGTDIPFRGAVFQLRADWAEIAHTMAVPQWSSHSQPCFLCRASHTDVYSKVAECGYQHVAWALKDVDAYDAACKACEIQVGPLTDDDWNRLKGMLASDHKKDGARGLALQDNFPKYALKRGDRLEPTPALWDCFAFFETKPEKVVFWRRSAETVALRRNPLFCKDLGLDLPSVVALDAMHTLCLGVHQQLVLWAIWTLLDKMPSTGAQRRSLSQANRHSVNLALLRRDYKDWLKETHRQMPQMVLTAVGDLTLDLLGTKAKPVLKTKAHETLTLLRWMAVLLPKHKGSIPCGESWAGAALELLKMWQLMETAPMAVPEATQKERSGNWGGHHAQIP